VNPDASRAWLRMLAVCGLIVAADQATKGAVNETLAMGERIDLVPGFDLTRVTNSGIAFGLLDGGGDQLVLAITIGALTALAVWFAFDPTRPWLWLGIGLLAGGALGNLADRVRADAVTDFLDPVIWPVFNLADIAITAGVVVIGLAAIGPEPEAAETKP
jgi:signal peptidase II